MTNKQILLTNILHVKSGLKMLDTVQDAETKKIYIMELIEELNDAIEIINSLNDIK